MKNSIAILKKYALVLLAVLICGLFQFHKCDSKNEKLQPAIIEQRNIIASKEDSLNTARAIISLYQKHSIIQVLNSKVAKEKANTAIQKAVAKKQHLHNDTFQSRFDKDKNLSNCEDLARGLKFEIIKKDSIIDSLDTMVVNYSSKVKELVEIVDIQKGIINSKESLIECKDSTIAYYKSQNLKTDYWNRIKMKAAGVILFIETVALLIK
jgi:hypothetical protein